VPLVARAIVTVDEMARTASGKVRKGDLRQQLRGPQP